MANTTQHMASQLEQLASRANGAGNTLIVCPVTNPWYPALAQLKTVDSVLGSSQIYPTLSSAVAAAVSGRGDTIVVTPGTYTQTSELVVDKNNLTIVGAGAQPEATKVVGPTTAGAHGIKVTASYVLVKNLQAIANSSGQSAGIAVFGSNCTIDGCRLGDTVAPTQSCGIVVPAALSTAGIFGTRILNCKIDTSVIGILLTAAATPKLYSNTEIANCLFQGNTSNDIKTTNSGTDVSASISIRDNTIIPGSATTPLDLAATTAQFSGIICNNRIAVATNAKANITGGKTLNAVQLYVGNYTQAGVTTAVPGP